MDATTTPTCPVCGARCTGHTPPPAGSAGASPGGSAGQTPGGSAEQTPPGAGYPPPAAPSAPGIVSDARGWSIAAHLSGLGAGLLSGGFLGFLGPLIVWLARRDEDAFTDHHAKEALNFQLTVLIVLLASTLLAIPVIIVGILTLGIGLILAVLAALAAIAAWVAFPIVGATKASASEGYRYPVTLRLIR